MAVVVIGHQGQLGSEMMRLLGAEGLGLDWPEIDLADPPSCLARLEALQPRVLVNCAAYTDVDACESDPACWKVNAAGPGHLARWAAAHDVFLVHVSTDYVFNGRRPVPRPWAEKDRPDPLSVYGKSKLAGEEAVRSSGARAAILRTAWLYGVHGRNFLKTILRLVRQHPGKEIRVVSDQFGSPAWAGVLARQIVGVLQAEAAGLFHAVPDGYVNRFDFAARFLDLMRVPHRLAPCPTAAYPMPAERPRNAILKNAELKRLGINLFKDWETDLERFVQSEGERLLAECALSGPVKGAC